MPMAIKYLHAGDFLIRLKGYTEAVLVTSITCSLNFFYAKLRNKLT